MIYTLTVNPSLDYIVKTDIVPNALNRSSEDVLYPGGKGINVSVMLTRLGCKNTAIVPIAGQTGVMLKDMLHRLVDAEYVFLDKGMTRINMKALGKNGETEINGKGINVCLDDLKRPLDHITPEDILVISGSFTDYSLIDKIVDYVQTDRIVYDIPHIEYALTHRPFVLKPNFSELEEYFGGEIQKDEVEKYAQRLLELGCRNVLISMGADGAYFCNKNFAFYLQAPQGRCINSIGSGDSMLAGLLYGIANSMPVENTVKLAVCCGSATAFTQYIATKEEVDILAAQI